MKEQNKERVRDRDIERNYGRPWGETKYSMINLRSVIEN